MSFKNFISNKPLFYKEIDFERFPKTVKNLRLPHALSKIVHLVGTNGKGSIGRFLSDAILRKKQRVLHFTSPHIRQINERFYKNGHFVTDVQLDITHEKLQRLLGQEAQNLSYFEYCTLMAIFLSFDCDYLIFEAGLGGEFDSTNCFKKILSIITPISLDHTEILGESIEAIATTKLKSVDKEAIFATQKFSEIAKVASGLGIAFKTFENILNIQELNFLRRSFLRQNLAPFLYDNMLCAASAFKKLGFSIEANSFGKLNLEGRLQLVKQNVYVDVGHNEASARVMCLFFEDRKIVLIYNSKLNKNYKKILEILKPVIKRVEFLPLNGDFLTIDDIEKVIKNVSFFKQINMHELYLVYGSFFTVKKFLNECS